MLPAAVVIGALRVKIFSMYFLVCNDCIHAQLLKMSIHWQTLVRACSVCIYYIYSAIKCFFITYRIYSVIRWRFFFFSFQNNPKDLNPSCKTDLDLWDCLGRVKLILMQNFIGLIQLFAVILEEQNPRLIAV